MAQCTAKSKQSGERCKRHAAPGRNVCVMHGGRTPRGADSPSFRHGRYSKHLPSRLAATYEASLSDPALLELREEIALVDARIGELLARTDSAGSAERWQEARDGYEQFQRAYASGKLPAMKAALQALGESITRGQSDYAAWDEIARALEQRRRLVESERRRAVEAQQMISAQQAMVLIAAILDVIRQSVTRHCTDAQTASRILVDASARIDHLITVGDGKGAEGGG